MSNSIFLLKLAILGSIGRLEGLQNFINKDINRGLVINRDGHLPANPREIAHFLDIPLLAATEEDAGLERAVSENRFRAKPDTPFGKGVGQVASRLLGVERTGRMRKRSLAQLFRVRKRS